MKLSIKNKSKVVPYFTIKFSFQYGFLLCLPYEQRNIARQKGFTFLKNKKVWATWDYNKAYQVSHDTNCDGIKLPKQLRGFFAFWKNDLWKNVKIIRKALWTLKKKCDFAQSNDHKGFSQSDKKYGWSLVEKRRWNKQDIIRAAWIVYRHRRQVEKILKSQIS